MILYHGSNTGNIQVLQPHQADHDRPYIYMSTLEVVAAFYLCNAVERPYYWFPYGFDKETGVPVYHELYQDALKEVSDGVSGYIYIVEADEDSVLPFKNIPVARLATQPMAVKDVIKVDNAYNLFMQYVADGKMKIGRYEDKTEKQLANWHNMILSYIKEKDMIKTPYCSYAMYIKKKFPQLWKQYEKEEGVE
ncbi:MAG: hypothetical protein IJN77_01445 [Oscillospiraceae bacterium]|nr:hypothetical protein [Oscillospiraceae bacterium]